MKRTVIFDLDGTLACGKHRLHLLPQEADASRTEAWDEFNLAAGDDAPIEDNIKLLRHLWTIGLNVIILTGRCDVARDVTLDWLKANRVGHNQLIMRPAADHRRDVEFKEEKLREIGLDNILCCFDDLEHVAKHIRSLGVTCHLVTHYDTPKVHTKELK